MADQGDVRCAIERQALRRSAPRIAFVTIGQAHRADVVWRRASGRSWMNGEANKGVVRRLGISHRAVEIHRGRAMKKLEARSPTELIRRVLLLGVAGG